MASERVERAMDDAEELISRIGNYPEDRFAALPIEVMQLLMALSELHDAVAAWEV